MKGQWTWGAGVGGVVSEADSAHGVALGLGYGITDELGAYGKLAGGLDGNSVGYFVGMEGVLGGP